MGSISLPRSGPSGLAYQVCGKDFRAHTQTNIVPFAVVTYEPNLKLCEDLAAKLPHGAHTKALLVSSGAEAVKMQYKSPGHSLMCIM